MTDRKLSPKVPHPSGSQKHNSQMAAVAEPASNLDAEAVPGCVGAQWA